MINYNRFAKSKPVFHKGKQTKTDKSYYRLQYVSWFLLHECNCIRAKARHCVCFYNVVHCFTFALFESGKVTTYPTVISRKI